MSRFSEIRHHFTSSWLNVLLVAAPISWWLAIRGDASMWIFVAAAHLADSGRRPDRRARRRNWRIASGPTLGGFLNATFGNAAELIIAIAALARPPHGGRQGLDHRQHHRQPAAGLRPLLRRRRRSRTARRSSTGRRPGRATVMLFLATVALVMPAVVDLVSFGSLQAHPEEIDRLSCWTSIVLLSVYIAGLVFSFRYQPRSAARRRTPSRQRPTSSIACGAHGAHDRHGADDGRGGDPGHGARAGAEDSSA